MTGAVPRAFNGGRFPLSIIVMVTTFVLTISPDPARDEGAPPGRVFRAGAAAVDVSPRSLPVRVNGGFLEVKADAVRDPLFARALVLDDGASKVAVVVVDSCMMPRELLDRAKALAREATGIPTDRMLISVTHTHSAPAAMGALGSAPDEAYVAFLPGKIAESVAKAFQNLRPARVGWASVEDAEDTHCRRWVRRPDRPVTDPFGRPSARANMHPGYQNPDAIGPSGPVDPELSVLAVQTPDGRPIALLANYSMHYFGAAPVSADYFGRFAATIGRLIGAGNDDPPFVGLMSQGTSGDQHWMDYGRPKTSITIDEYAESVARSALAAYRKVAYRDGVTLAMAETTLRLRRRVPDEARLAWARKVVAEMGDRAPKNQPEVYAREAIFLRDEPERELKLQALRIGDLGIAAIPNEVFALTGLKIKARSPLKSTFTIELANGSEGYIPPPEQHALGGYTTWPARTAALEVQAEPKIVDAVLRLLETVAGKPAREVEPVKTPYAEAVLAAKPWAYWRLEEMQGDVALDATGRGHVGQLSPGFARYLDGPESRSDRAARPVNHAVQLVGGSVCTADGVKPTNTVVLAFWNGLPGDVRAVTGVLVDRGRRHGRLAIGGSRNERGRLFLDFDAPDVIPASGPEIALKRWYHLALVRDGPTLKVYLDGRAVLSERRLDSPDTDPTAPVPLTVGGSSEPNSGFEGKVDEVSIFDRALTAGEVAALYAAFKAS
jgi:hypothetical protein